MSMYNLKQNEAENDRYQPYITIQNGEYKYHACIDGKSCELDNTGFWDFDNAIEFAKMVDIDNNGGA